VRRLLGWLLITMGGFAFLVSLLGVLDPSGARLADDGRPFGSPDPWFHYILLSSAYLVATVIGIWLVKSARSNRGAV